jgi:hypothetical protein
VQPVGWSTSLPKKQQSIGNHARSRLERHRFGGSQVLERSLDEASELAPGVNFGGGSPDI